MFALIYAVFAFHVKQSELHSNSCMKGNVGKVYYCYDISPWFGLVNLVHLQLIYLTVVQQMYLDFDCVVARISSTEIRINDIKSP